MRTELYYKKADAYQAAKEFAAEVDGFISDRLGCVDERCSYDYIDREMRARDLSGETAALMVVGGSEDGRFGYWEDED